MGKDKKKFEEQLQDIRHKHKDKIGFRKRKQAESLDAEYLKEELKKLKDTDVDNREI